LISVGATGWEMVEAEMVQANVAEVVEKAQ
jgi:hypothetical protein